MPQYELGVSVLKSACNSEAKDLAVEWTELGLDALLDDGVLKDTQCLEQLSRFARSRRQSETNCPKKGLGLSARMSQVHGAGERELREGAFEGPEESKETRRYFSPHPHKLDDLEKPQMVAKAFAALVREKIGLETFERLAAAVEIGFIEDLKVFVNEPFDRIFALHPALLKTALVEMQNSLKVGNGAFHQSASLDYAVSGLGKFFIGYTNENYDFKIWPPGA